MLQITSHQANPKWEDYDATEEYDTPLGKLYIYKTDNFLWKLELENGELPKQFQGEWTTLNLAWQMKDQLIQEYSNVKETTVPKIKGRAK